MPHKFMQKLSMNILCNFRVLHMRDLLNSAAWTCDPDVQVYNGVKFCNVCKLCAQVIFSISPFEPVTQSE